MIDILIISAIIILGNAILNFFKNDLTSKDILYLKRLWMYHLLFGIIYYTYIVYGPGGDSLGYYITSNELSLSQAWSLFIINGPGTYAMYLLNTIPTKFFSFFSMTLLYTLIGYIAFVLYYLLFNNLIKFNSRLGKFRIFPLIFFLPNLHFWSAGLGKDTLLFFCIAGFLYSIQNITKRVFFMIFVLSLSYLIRPHITIFLIAAYGLGYTLDRGLKFYQKILIILVFIGAFIFLFDNVMAYLKIEDLSTDALNEFSESRVGNLSRASTGSSVDISNYPFPLKIFTFLYRPLFFDINGVLAIIASFENLLLLILSFKLIKSNPIKTYRNGSYLIKGSFLFLIMGVISFSLILGNLGIMLRQKNMFLPILLFLCLYSISEKYRREKFVS